MNESHEDRRDRIDRGDDGSGTDQMGLMRADSVETEAETVPAAVGREMHELALLRAEVPEPDALVLARARLTLGTAIAREAEAAAPAGGAPAARRGVWRRRAAAVRGRRRTTVRLGMAASLAAAITAGVVVTDSLTRDGRPMTGASASATTRLNLAADATLNAKDLVPGPGQYLYLRADEVAVSATDTFAYLTGRSDETWVPADASAVWMEQRVDHARASFFHKGDEKIVRESGIGLDPERTVRRAPGGRWWWCTPDGAVGESKRGKQPGAVRCNGLGNSWQSPSPAFMATLPRDPQALLRRIHDDSKGHGQGRDAEAFVYIADILRGGTVPADLRAALYRAAALIPGVTAGGDSVNLDGQHGVAVGVERDGVRQELVFNPSTGDYIGRRDVVVDPAAAKDLVRTSVPAGTVIESTSLHRAIVDRLGATPTR